MKFRLGLSVVFSVLGFFIFASSASAHVLVTDGNIGAILHINPDDSPVSGTPTYYVLYFEDLSHKLDLNHCNCKAIIRESGQTIGTQTLTITDYAQSDNVFTFPRPDVYSLSIVGQPTKGYDFQSFKLNYVVRVSGGGQNNKDSPIFLYLGLGMMVLLILLAAYKSTYI